MEKETTEKKEVMVVAYTQGSSPEIVTLQEAMDRHMFVIEEIDDKKDEQK